MQVPDQARDDGLGIQCFLDYAFPGCVAIIIFFGNKITGKIYQLRHANSLKS